jgi:hypothetical protein
MNKVVVTLFYKKGIGLFYRINISIKFWKIEILKIIFKKAINLSKNILLIYHLKEVKV